MGKLLRKRSIKNIITILIIALAITSAAFTLKLAVNDQSSDAASNANSTETTESTETSENSQANDQTQTQVTTSDSNSSQQTPPEKPSGDSSSEVSNSSASSDSNSDSQPPEMPSDSGNSNGNSSGSNSNSAQVGGQAPNGNASQGEMPQQMGSTYISMKYYIILGGEFAIAACAIMYLVMSCANKKTFKQTFVNKDKVIILVLSAVIITSGLTMTSTKYTDKIFGTNNEMQDMQGGSSSVEYSAALEINEDTELTSGTYDSTNSDENTISVSGNITASLSNLTVTKSGDASSGDNSNFYGTNSAIIAKDGATLTLKNMTISTTANGANGVFSFGGSATTNNSSSDGTTVEISNSKITTTGDNAGGIMTTGGGTTKATNLTINTSGTSSAAIRSDRGGGTVTVNKGTYTTTGAGSPAIYLTADITVKNATLTAKASEGAVIEGSNSITLEKCTLTDTNNKLNGLSTSYKNIFIYQSASGDASEGDSEFTSKNSTITTNKGDSIYVTNTTTTINLENNTITNNDSTGNFLRAKADSWGTSGSNGGNVTLNMKKQNAIGNIVIDSVSTLEMSLKSSSYYEGTINGDNTAKSIALKFDKSSKIKLTGDSYVTSLDDADSSYSNIDFNGYKLYVNGKAIN